MTTNLSDAKPSVTPTPPLPLFFHRVEVLDTAKHKELKLNRGSGFRFAANSNSVPVCLEEIIVAADHFPIVFSQVGLMPVVVVGCRDGENVFVDAAGRWRSGAYIPAYLRTWPFIAVAIDENPDKVFMAIETNSAHLQLREGLPLFDNGNPSRLLSDIISLSSFYRNNLKDTQRFAQALDDAGVLQEQGATVKFRNGDATRLRGFKVVDPVKLDTLSDSIIAEWRKMRWLAPLYAVLRSAARWSQLVEATEERRIIQVDLMREGQLIAGQPSDAIPSQRPN